MYLQNGDPSALILIIVIIGHSKEKSYIMLQSVLSIQVVRGLLLSETQFQDLSLRIMEIVLESDGLSALSSI